MSNPLGNNGGRLYSTLIKPVLIEGSFVVASGNGLGITSLKGANVQDVFMRTTISPTRGNSGVLNPLTVNASNGYALVKLTDNYARYLGNFTGMVSALSGSSLGISGGSLTVGAPFVITSVGHASLGAVTISPTVADVAGNYAGRWFSLFDGYGQTFVLWFSVTGVGGAAPSGVSGTLVQVPIASGATINNITTALSAAISVLPSPISGVTSFTCSGGGGATLTVTSTQTNPYGPLPGAPREGLIATQFTFVNSVTRTNNAAWQAVGVPMGVTPAVGVSFIATSTGNSTGGSSTGLVQAPGTAGITAVEVVGDPTVSLGPIPMGGSPNPGGWIMLQFLNGFSSFAYNSGSPDESLITDTLVPSAPADGMLVRFAFLVELSGNVIQGD